MKIAIWVVQILTALAFLASGTMKFLTPYAELAANPGMEWVYDFSATQIKIISALEVLGALGVILPMFLKKYQKLVPIAAIGLALIMIGAAITHINRGEPIIANVVLFVLASLTAYGRKDLLKS